MPLLLTLNSIIVVVVVDMLLRLKCLTVIACCIFLDVVLEVSWARRSWTHVYPLPGAPAWGMEDSLADRLYKLGQHLYTSYEILVAKRVVYSIIIVLWLFDVPLLRRISPNTRRKELRVDRGRSHPLPRTEYP